MLLSRPLSWSRRSGSETRMVWIAPGVALRLASMRAIGRDRLWKDHGDYRAGRSTLRGYGERQRTSVRHAAWKKFVPKPTASAFGSIGRVQ
jgi:hypothetical protein